MNLKMGSWMLSSPVMVSRIPTFIFLFFLNGASGATITVFNDCEFTVWPGISGTPGYNVTGFELKQGHSRSFQVAESWDGLLWGRTGCTFNGSSRWWCAIGDCGSGEMECYGRKATAPVTMAWFSLNYLKDTDSYDVSLFNGYNLGMTVEATDGSGPCQIRGCNPDLNELCPSELRLDGGEGCKTACQAFGSSDYCCQSRRETWWSECKPTPYDKVFESACPRSSSTSFDYWKVMSTCKACTCRGANYNVRFCPSVEAFSTIKLGGQLKSTDQLLSLSGSFTLGFFGSNYSYLGIWYTGDDQSRKVWVANPNKPIISTSGVHALSIDPNTGNLIVTAEGRTLMRITDVQVGPNTNLTATLEDSGNFMLINETDKRVLWQSFDHPTNVLLPGMKLGYDMRTGQNRTLTSWLSDDILDSGAFTLSWEPIDEKSQRLMIRQRGQPYWTSGNLNDHTFQYMFPLNPSNGQFNYFLTSVYNTKERYFGYQTNYDQATAFPMWILTPKGKITNFNNSDVWTPEFCYGYNSSNGCLESTMPRCRKENVIFSYENAVFAPDMTDNSTDSNSRLSISDCFIKCWNDCSCVGFNSSTTNGTGCVI